MGLIPGWGTKIPHVMWCSQNKKTKKTKQTNKQNAMNKNPFLEEARDMGKMSVILCYDFLSVFHADSCVSTM